MPLLAAFLDEPFEPSPYSPASRLFWNEFYLAIERIPELERSPVARELSRDGRFSRQSATPCGRQTLVDYPRVMALKRRVLTELATTFFRDPGQRRASYEKFLADKPRAEDYAAFRATVERRRTFVVELAGRSA